MREVGQAVESSTTVVELAPYDRPEVPDQFRVVHTAPRGYIACRGLVPPSRWYSRIVQRDP